MAQLIYICIWTAVAYKYQSEIFFYFQFLSKLYRRGFLRWLETSTQPLALGKDSKWILFLRQRNLIILMLKSGCNRNQSHPLDMVAGAGFEPTTFGLWARRATELLYPAIYNSAVFYSFIIIALCKGCVNSFLHIFLFYALPGFFDWIYLHFNLSFLRVCTQLYGGTDANKRFKYLLKQKWDCAK